MHLLARGSASLDDLAEAIDLGQTTAEVCLLSFSDSDLGILRRAYTAGSSRLPAMTFLQLRDLRHPLSIDLWIKQIAPSVRVILVRVLGGYTAWPYGCGELHDLAARSGIKVVLLPGECSQDDVRLQVNSTVGEEDRRTLLECFRAGGIENISILLERLAVLAGYPLMLRTATALPRVGLLGEQLAEDCDVAILVYRSMVLADDIAPAMALEQALTKQDRRTRTLYLPGLRDRESCHHLEEVLGRIRPRLLVSTMGFASGEAADGSSLFRRLDIPVFQAPISTTRQNARDQGTRGLTPVDLAMHVVLPEIDGRVFTTALSFKRSNSELPSNGSDISNVELVAARLCAFLRLQEMPSSARRILVLMPDYAGAAGRTGYAIGLDVPNSLLALLHDLHAAGYDVRDIPSTPRALLSALEDSRSVLLHADYRLFFASLPAVAADAVRQAWGEVLAEDFAFHTVQLGNITVALPPDRGRSASRRADYHDPALPPAHALLAFGAWLRHHLGCHAIVHFGAHGTLEWLPGKTVALTESCFPQIVVGDLPVIYPFIVSNPGEAAQAKRRISAVTIGHLTPPLIEGTLSEEARQLEQLVDEYAQAEGLDPLRRDRLAALIIAKARQTGLAEEAGILTDDDSDAALSQIDAWLCDLKELAIKDGLHIFGRADPSCADPLRLCSAEAERRALLAALDGRHVPAGPAGAPGRGRSDVLPTGRNLFATDPRTLPTRTAQTLGETAAEEILRRHLQDNGEWPRSIVLDLWGSASLRTGGEEIAQGLALMGCRPQWDSDTGRVTGIEVLPPAVFGRPRIDVTWRISGLFRDMFPMQIALIGMASAAVAAREEADEENPLAAARRAGATLDRIFGSAPGVYGAGIEDKLGGEEWQTREELGQLYLEAASHAFGGAEGEGYAAPGAFAARLREADMLVHISDDPGRDLFEGSADLAFVGGFAAAVAALGGKADIVMLDTTDPGRPRARSLVAAINRLVRGRVLNPRFIAGQMRHGPRGAAEFAEAVDKIVGFAETTDSVSPTLLDAVHDTYLGREEILAFLRRENPAALGVIAGRLLDARRRGLWPGRRNSLEDDLRRLIAEART